MIATSYPLLDLFWTMLELFFFVVWIFILVSVIFDIFRNHEMRGGMKALWLVFVVFLPLFGVLAYLIVHGSDMHERRVREAQAQQQAFDQYVRKASGERGGGTADELSKLADLKAKGVITDEEFEAQKAKILA